MAAYCCCHTGRHGLLPGTGSLPSVLDAQRARTTTPKSRTDVRRRRGAAIEADHLDIADTLVLAAFAFACPALCGMGTFLHTRLPVAPDMERHANRGALRGAWQ